MPANAEDLWCFAWTPGTERAVRGAALKSALWKPGDVISICFLDGAKKLQDRVKEAAGQWVGPTRANLRFLFQKEDDAHIRISFQGRGSWSSLGTSCKKVARGKPTMNLGWSDDSMEATVLHEFGHALGLVHEHMNPATRIDWNKPNVQAALAGPPHFWTAEQIERNVFARYEKSETNFTKFDPLSIMLYPMPAHWTRSGFASVPNQQLSATDVAHIRRLYPHG
jgi:serralysin